MRFTHLLAAYSLFLLSCGNNSSSKQEKPIEKQPQFANGTGWKYNGIALVAPVSPIDSQSLLPLLAMNPTSITIIPYAFTGGKEPYVRFNMPRQWWGEKEEGIRATLRFLPDKIAIMMKPHLWLPGGEYTGDISFENDADWTLWEHDYSAYILHYAQIAEGLHIPIFCIGTELVKSVKARPQYWEKLIDDVRNVYHGQLTYAANWDDYADFPHWQKLDFIGIDAYFPLSDKPAPSLEDIKKGWEQYTGDLEKISKQFNHPILFTEYGYRNADEACIEPWKEDNKTQNDALQKDALDALYQTFSGKGWFAGGYLWKWYADGDESKHHQGATDFTPQNKPALEVVKEWYK